MSLRPPTRAELEAERRAWLDPDVLRLEAARTHAGIPPERPEVLAERRELLEAYPADLCRGRHCTCEPRPAHDPKGTR